MKDHPEMRTLDAHKFWPQLLPALASSVPIAHRLICACVVLTYQNAEVERDLAILKRLRTQTCGQLGDASTDGRARLQIDGPAAQKERGHRVCGFVRHVVGEWAGECSRRQRGSGAGSGSTAGQKVPQRAAKRQAGPNRQIVEAEPCGELAYRGCEGEDRPEDLCEFLAAP